MLLSLVWALVLCLASTECCLGSEQTTPKQLIRHSTYERENPTLSHYISKRSEDSSPSTDSDGVKSTEPPRALESLEAEQHSYSFDDNVSNFISSAVLQFALDTGRLLNINSDASKNDVFSPMSVLSALSLLLLGAKGNSYQELVRLLHVNSIPNKYHEEFGYLLEDLGVHPKRARQKVNWQNTFASSNLRGANRDNSPIQHIVQVANGVFAQSGYNLNPYYSSVAKHIYGSELVQLDFQHRSAEARDYINKWVDIKTFGKIPNIINDNIPRSTNLILASALYFKGFWENTFFKKATTVSDFFPNGLNKPPIKVQMMATGGVFPYYDSVENDCRIIGLPYRGNLTTMYVIQPKNSSRDTLKQFQAQLNAQIIEDLISKMERKSAIIAFPKMHLVRTLNMKDLLTLLGVNDIFHMETSDLSLIEGAQQYPRDNHQMTNFNNDVHSGLQFSPAAQGPIRQGQLFHTPLTNTADSQSSQSPISHAQSLNPTFASTPSRQSHLLASIAHQQFTDRFGEKPLIVTKSESRSRRSLPYDSSSYNPLEQLEAQRRITTSTKSNLFVDDILHKVDIEVNEEGTEAAAATLTFLRRSGPDVLFRAEAPFLILIRHDPTKLVLFYGIINEPKL